MLDKTYHPAEVEEHRYRDWERSGRFAAADSNAAPFTIAMPPPNITGSLHMGHALNHTVQDTLTRFERMRGRRALWQPGTDHAGIATQMIVERQLAARGIDRRQLGRDAFLREIWAWKEQSGGTIVKQLKRLGASPDWSRQRFTMDDGLSDAVRTTFVKLHKQGLIYRDKRLVNWDPKLQTAISDLEVQQTEVNGHLWYFRYPIEGMDGTFITVATTRPETMLGDTGVAVHPDDDRYRHLVGRHAILPLVGRRILIVADAYSDPEKGTGAVKITPAHDFNDFEVGRRHGLEAISILDARGRVTDDVPEPYRGLDRFEARKRIVADIEALGLLDRVEPHKHAVPHGDRSGVPVEPLLTDQWYCDAATLARPAIAAVEDGRTRFVPQQWENTYFEWMRNIQPWCISRQLWWGHQIPAWHAPDGTIFVEETEEAALAAARLRFGEDIVLRRDEDVLDTWFSSALWPFSTLGWPERTPELLTHYPTDVLVTGFDIIFFWVARMMMMGLHLMDEVPFHTVYIHGLVRDEQGQKMSKTKGNVVDPIDLVDSYGADALRFAILASLAQGRDIKFGPSRVEGYRNFVTKLWNASRFLELNEVRLGSDFIPTACNHKLNRWIISEITRTTADVTAALETFRFNDAAQSLYRFTWDNFCDWYIELSKPLFGSDDAALVAETRQTAAWVMARLLHLLHPLTPFVTEELWDSLMGSPGGMLIGAAWPIADLALLDEKAEAELRWVIRAIGSIRTARNELNVPGAAKLALEVHNAAPETVARLKTYNDALVRLARLSTIDVGAGEIPKNALQVVVDEAMFVLPLAGVVDLAEERARLGKEIAKAGAEITKIDAKLANASFRERAPAEIIAEQLSRKADNEALLASLTAALARIA